MTTALATLKRGTKPLSRSECIVDGCKLIADHPVQMLCHKHYMRKHRTGSTESSRRERGTGTITSFGYVAIANNGKKKQEHVLIVESLIGKNLKAGCEVHHVDGNKNNNTNSNLVVCPSKAYHKLIHARHRAFDMCGNANFRKCPFCKKYSDINEMKHNKSSRYFYHTECKTKYNQNRSKP